MMFFSDPSILLRRDGPSTDYLQLLNTDLKNQTRGGHLVVGPRDNRLPAVPPPGSNNLLQNKTESAIPPPAKPVLADPL